MAAPRKTGHERGGRKKPADKKQGNGGPANLTVLPGGKPDISTPAPPIKLGKTAMTVWKTFWESPLASSLDSSDHYALSRWIKAVQKLEEFEGTIDRTGVMVEGSMGQVRMNPLFSRVEKLEDQISKAEQQFGMTPLARMKLGIAIGESAMTAAKMNEMTRKAGDGDSDETPQAIEAEVIEGFEPA